MGEGPEARLLFYSFKNAVSGELASATNPMACIPSPASYAVRPASTACLKAFAISIGLPATAIAVFTRHADAPISIASAAWLGAPIPASTTTGIPACSIMICRNSLVCSPLFVTIGAPSGNTVEAP